MRDALRSLIIEPTSGAELRLITLESTTETDGSIRVIDGILFDSAFEQAYRIIDGVPIMFRDAFTKQFLERHSAAITENFDLRGLSLKAARERDWSFSKEWDEHFDSDSERTWGYTPEERIEQFLLETQIDREWLKGKTVMDADGGDWPGSSPNPESSPARMLDLR